VLQSFDPVVALGDSVLNQGGLELHFRRGAPLIRAFCE
jgi:hypothetical protein